MEQRVRDGGLGCRGDIKSLHQYSQTTSGQGKWMGEGGNGEMVQTKVCLSPPTAAGTLMHDLRRDFLWKDQKRKVKSLKAGGETEGAP